MTVKGREEKLLRCERIGDTMVAVIEREPYKAAELNMWVCG